MTEQKSPLEVLVKTINKQYGEGTLMFADQATGLVIDRIPSGILSLDLQMGGGFPRGRISMIKGDYSTGKSAISMLTVAQAQRTCRYCGTPFESLSFYGEVSSFSCECKRCEPMRAVWLEAEHSWDSHWASKWGVDTKSLYIIETEFAEQAIDVADMCIRSKECDLLVVDSIAALTPGVEVEESSQKWQMGVLARLIGKALRKWTSGLNSYGLLGQTKCTIILINQLRLSFGGYHPTITSPGGRGLDFFESLEIRFKKKEVIEDTGSKRPIGITVEFVIKKNKTAPPGQGGLFSLYFIPVPGRYTVGSTDIDMQVLQLAAFWNLIQKGGPWYTFPGGTRVKGKEAAASLLKDNPLLLEELIRLVAQRELAWQNTGDLGLETKEDKTNDSEKEDDEEDS